MLWCSFAKLDAQLSPVGHASRSHIQMFHVTDSVIDASELDVLTGIAAREIGEFARRLELQRLITLTMSRC
jgi:hypothetical protein